MECPFVLSHISAVLLLYKSSNAMNVNDIIYIWMILYFKELTMADNVQLQKLMEQSYPMFHQVNGTILPHVPSGYCIVQPTLYNIFIFTRHDISLYVDG